MTVKNGSTTLKEGTDYTKTVSLISKETKNNVTTYTHEIILTGIGKYTGTYKVTGTSQSADKIVLDLSKYTVSDKEYTGKQIRPTFTITGSDGNGKTVTLKQGTDYTISYGSNVNVGFLAGTMTVTGIGKYTGTTLIRFNIVKAKIKSLPNISNQFYTGKAITPLDKITLSDGRVLTEGTHFTVKYSNNKNVGTATATVTFKGNYEGTVSKLLCQQE